MPSFLTRQPGAGLYVTYTILCGILELPVLLLFYALPFARPARGWSYYQSLANALTRLVFHCLAVIEHAPTRSLEPGTDGPSFVVMHPGDDVDELYRGPLHPSSTTTITTNTTTTDDGGKEEGKEKVAVVVTPGDVGGLWIPSAKGRQGSDEARRGTGSVVLHFHGGAFVLLSPRAPAVQWGPLCLAEELCVPVLMVDYRLASESPSSCFPAALQDAVTAYRHLLHDLGVTPDRIILSGDSAGANLVLALLRYISEYGAPAGLPAPAGAFLCSPWADLSRSPAEYAHVRTDYITPTFIAWGVRAYVPVGEDMAGPYFSPARHPFATPARIFVQVGEKEAMREDVNTLVREMQAVAGNAVRVSEVGNGSHATFAAGTTLGFEKEARETARAAGEFLGVKS